MNNFLRITFLLILFGISANTLAATKKTVSYGAVKSWSDSKSVFFLYSKKTSLVHYSLSDIDGTVIKENSESFYQQIDKNLNLNEKIIDLDKGTPANGLIYKDSDFTLIENAVGVSVSNQDHKFTLPCDRKIWGFSNPVRFENIIFYCGNIIPLAGGKTSRLPPKLEQEIASFAIQHVVSKTGVSPVIITCIKDGRNLNLVAFDDGRRRDASLDFFAINMDTLASGSIKKLPFDSTYFQTVNHLQAQFINGFVVKKRIYSPSDPTVQICSTSVCMPIVWPNSFAYLTIDEFTNQGIFLERANLVTSKAKITVVKHILGPTP